MKPTKADRDAAFAEVFLHMFTPHVVQSFQLGHLIAIQRESVICEVREALVKYMAPERKRARRERDVRGMALDACRLLDQWYVTHNAQNTTPRPDSPLAKAREALALDKEQGT